ncbi:hypothetical protein [Streptomyces macrosporus]|uniref:Uncharacterized protein n=1 Tax=Streptomyces macrosporus TaxID=44032 RepID=A0ABN3KED1_9ACTN
MAVILHPDTGFSGPGPGGLQFEDGRAETDDPRAVAYCRNAGYRIGDEPAASQDVPREEAEDATRDESADQFEEE